MSSMYFKICTTVATILGTAMVANYGLQLKNPKNPTLAKVKVIIRSWWLIAAFFLGSLAYPPITLLLAFAAVSCFAVLEYLKHSRLQALKKPLAAFAFLSIALQYGALYVHNWHLFFALPLLLSLVGFGVFLVASAQVERIDEVFSTCTGLVLIFHFISYLPGLWILTRQTRSADEALLITSLVFLLTELNDVFQFLCGKNFGKRKIVPAISPNKTLAGFIGGVILTSLTSTLLFTRFLGFAPVRSVILGFLISVMGMIGDLTFSSVKRYFGTKDFSEALPGHGGLLDRLDSLVFTAPVVFYFLFFWRHL